MIIYNVTINVDDSILEEWMTWIRHHIPEVLATGKFSEAKLTKVLVDEEMGGTTFSVQYRARSREALEAYYNSDADDLRKDGMQRFADKASAFRTELEIIEEFRADQMS